LAPGENITVTLNMTVTSNHSQGHLLRVIVDPDNTMPETNEGNNQREAPYDPLAPGSCP
jgi:subtilase family serine protease